MPEETIDDDLTILQWRVKVKGSTVGAFDSIERAAAFVSSGAVFAGKDGDLRDVMITFSYVVI